MNAVRKMPLSVRYSYLEILASGGEGVYYFVEQLTWCAVWHRLPGRAGANCWATVTAERPHTFDVRGVAAARGRGVYHCLEQLICCAIWNRLASETKGRLAGRR